MDKKAQIYLKKEINDGIERKESPEKNTNIALKKWQKRNFNDCNKNLKEKKINNKETKIDGDTGIENPLD